MHAQDLLMPALIDRCRWLLQIGDANCLYGKMFAVVPVEFGAVNEMAQARMKWHHVIVIQVDLDKALPVVVAGVLFDAIKHIA